MVSISTTKSTLQPLSSPTVTAATQSSAATATGVCVTVHGHFYQPPQLRTLAQISADILALEQETEGLLHEITKGATA